VRTSHAVLRHEGDDNDDGAVRVRGERETGVVSAIVVKSLGKESIVKEPLRGSKVSHTLIKVDRQDTRCLRFTACTIE
jgi:hypothetical protein